MKAHAKFRKLTNFGRRKLSLQGKRHLCPAQFDDVAVCQRLRRHTDRRAIEQGRALTFGLGNRIAIAHLADHRHQQAGAAQRRRGLGQRHALAGIAAIQYLYFAEQRRRGDDGGAGDGHIPAQRPLAIHHKLDLEFRQRNLVLIAQEMLADAVTVDERAIRAVKVFEKGIVEDRHDDGVLAAHRLMAEHDVVVAVTAHGHPLLVELDRLRHLAVARYDQF
jgi:hypothetical protein